MMKLDNVIVYLLGFPGVGKYTIAKDIISKSNARLVDNHLINNPVFGVIDLADGAKVPEEAWIQIRKIRAAVFESIKTISPADFSFVFTNMLMAGCPKDQNIYDLVHDVAKGRNAIFVPVRLQCNPEENTRRISDVDRRNRLKPTKIDIVKMAKEETLIDVDHANLLDLDVSDLLPAKAAETILEHCSRIALAKKKNASS